MRKEFKLISIFMLFFLVHNMMFGTEERENSYKITVPQFDKAPIIDGIMEYPLWDKAVVLDSFTQYEPREGNAPSEKTIVYMGFDSNNLYIAVQCFDSNPKGIRACLAQRDKVEKDDGITIFLDTFNDKKRAFAFSVNPCGIQTDGIYTEIRRRRPGMGFSQIDKNWDTYFFSNARKDEKGFVIEISIPFKSIRFPNTPQQIWGLQIMRKIQRKNEEIYWHPRSRNINGFLIQAGEIRIDGKLKTGKNIEIMPVATGFKEMNESFSPELGLNLKYGLTSDLTADLTLNPDFSQIEADMPQINVNQRFSLYFPEKRPFFLEGKDFFDTPMEMFYSRTLVNPDWGIKLTGKIGKTTLGILSAYDQSPRRINLPNLPEEDEELETGDRAFVNIIRLKQDLFKESHIGLILTDKEIGSSWNSVGRDFNRVVGVDGYFKIKNLYQFTFQILGSQSRSGPEKTGISPAMTFNLSRNTRHLQISTGYYQIPEEFEASSGYLRRKDIKQFRTRIGYAILPQNEWIVDIRPSIEYRRAWDFNNILTDEEFRIGWFISGWRGTYFWGGFTTEMERYNGEDFHRDGVRLSLGSDPLSWMSFNISYSFGKGIYYEDDPYLGYKTSGGFRLTFKPLSNVQLYYNYQNDKFFKNRGGEKVYSVNVVSQRLSYQISRTLSMRLITDYNDYDKLLYNSLLLSWELKPGTVFFIGVDDNRDKINSKNFQIQGRVFFLKFSYWWRV